MQKLNPNIIKNLYDYVIHDQQSFDDAFDFSLDKEVFDVSAGSSDYDNNYSDPIIYNGKLYFSGNNGTKNLLYEYNGVEISNVSIGTSDYDNYFSNPIVYDGNLYFTGNNGSIYIIYKFDGVEISNVSVGTSDYYDGFNNAIIYNGLLHFYGNTNKVYTYDGIEISNISASISIFGDPIEYDNNLYFNGNGFNMYKYDGVNATLVSVGTSDYDNYFSNPIVYNGNLYFSGNNGTKELMYKYDGVEISNISIGTSDYDNSFNIFKVGIIYDGNLYFNAKNSTENLIYKFDGIEISNISVGTSDYVNNFDTPIIYKENLYFNGYFGVADTKIYKYDGIEISNISVGASDYERVFNSPIIYNKNLYFGGFGNSSLGLYRFNDISFHNVSISNSSSDGTIIYPIIYGDALFFKNSNGTIHELKASTTIKSEVYRYKDGIKNIYFVSNDYTLTNLTTLGMETLNVNNVTECFIEHGVSIDGGDILSSILPIPKNVNPLNVKQAIELLEIGGDVLDATPKFIVTASGKYELNENPSIINNDPTLANPSDSEIVSTQAITEYINNIIVVDWDNENTAEVGISTNALNQPQDSLDFFGFVFSKSTSILQALYDIYGNLNIRTYDGTTWTNWNDSINDRYVENFSKQNFKKQYEFSFYYNTSYNDSSGLNKIVYSKELNKTLAFYGISSDKVQISNDGINWTEETTAENVEWRDIIWVKELSKFIGITNGTNKIQYSSDSINWITTPSGNDSNLWQSICWSPELNMLVSVASTGTNLVQYSYDGINWTTTASGNESNQWQSICWSPELSMFVSVANTGTNRVQYSYDGINWTIAPSANDIISWVNIHWSSELKMFVSIGTGSIQYSYNGINWTEVVLSGSRSDIIWVDYYKMFFVVTGAKIEYSYDGINWNDLYSHLAGFTFDSICYNEFLKKLTVTIANGIGNPHILNIKRQY